MSKIKGLYVHLPFCKQICSYCAFYKMQASRVKQTEYIDYLLKEIALVVSKNAPFTSVYFGGGTPSTLANFELERLFKALMPYLKTASEITMEMNPEDITAELLELLKKYGINRLSIGVQTFEVNLQKLLHRPLTYSDLRTKLALARRFGFANINLDLIYAIPGETLGQVKRDLRRICRLKPNHISLYGLMYEEHTMLMNAWRTGDVQKVSEETESKMYFTIAKILKRHHFIHYETSNFAREGSFSRHNLIYWNEEEYLGIGAGSSSFIDDVRYQNINNLAKYYQGIDQGKLNHEEEISLTKINKMEEEVMLGLRLIKGIDEKRFLERYNVDIKQVFPNIDELIKQKLLIEQKSFLRLNHKYLYIANFVINKII